MPARTSDDQTWMQAALAQAKMAWRQGEIPVGAVIISGGRALSRGHNQPIKANDPTAHAEIVAVRRACRKRNNYRLDDCDLYVTLEPCAMCLAAIVQARIKRLVYGAADPKAGAVRSIMKFPFEKTNHRLEVTGGVLAGVCGQILKDFFSAKRKKSAG